MKGLIITSTSPHDPTKPDQPLFSHEQEPQLSATAKTEGAENAEPEAATYDVLFHAPH